MRLRSQDGAWQVDLINLAWTGDGRDGPRLRITRNGYFVAEVRTMAELARYLDPDDLEEALPETNRRPPPRPLTPVPPPPGHPAAAVPVMAAEAI